jgi:RHS repeat-associated protein
MLEPGRKFAQGNSKYRYGFNGKENDNEVKGEGNQQDYGMRIYDPRLGRFLSVDPLNKQYPYYTPYSFAGNKPIKHIDLDGLEEAKNWMDYSFTDLMQWLEKPSNPAKDNGFLHSFGSSFNRNFNPIYYGYVITTGDDPSSSDYGKMNRLEAAQNLETMLILHKSFTIAVKPSPAAALEQQMAKNEAAMGSSAAAKSVVNSETTAAASGQRANMSAQEIQNIKNYISNLNTKSSVITVKSTAPQVGGDFGSLGFRLSENGNINLTSRAFTNGTFDFVVTNEGKLVVGNGHYNLSGGASSVKAAGQIQLYKGKVMNINNSSGHYMPSIEEAKNFGNILKEAGANVSGAKLNLYDAAGKKAETIKL